MNLLVRSCAVRPTICWSEGKSMRFCLLKYNKVCELSDSQDKRTLDGNRRIDRQIN